MLTADVEGKTLSLPPEKRPTIWLVLDLSPKKRGSLETEVIALAARLSRAQAQVTVVFAAAPPAWLARALWSHGAQVRLLDFNRPFAAALELLQWMERSRPDLVHFHFIRAYSPLVTVARAMGARVMLHDHITLGQPASPSYPVRPPALQLLARGYKRARAVALNGLVDRRIAVSRFVAQSVMESEFVAPERVTVVENGVDVARFFGGDGESLRTELRAGDRPLVACVSRLAPEKGVDLLIRAMKRVGRDAMLLVVGDGPELAVCRDQAAALGLGDHVHFLGLRDDVERVYAAADLVVMPSLWDEAFGLVLVEAMAAGKPVVVTRSGAMPEIVEQGHCGLVVPKHDEVSMAGAIGRLLDDAMLRLHMGRAARERALAAYTLPQWVDRMMEEYAALVPSLALSVRRAA
jgi:glycosyltransferase involved in cell wall biosynthesis